MPAEPINIFSAKVDPSGVLEKLRTLAPELKVTGPNDNWRKIVITGPKRFLRKPTTTVFTHDPAYYHGAGWARQIQGMQEFFSRFPDNDRKPAILEAISSFRFVLATKFVPELRLDSRDERLAYIFAVARHLDGVIFTPSALRDATGRVLIAAAGAADPEARLSGDAPQTIVPPKVVAPPTVSLRASRSEPARVPPTPLRVARRALALVAVTGRALLEQRDRMDPEADIRRKRLIEWVTTLKIEDELERDEWKLLERRVGSLEEQATVDATWRLEGLAVLAWALGRFSLPTYDRLVEPTQLYPALGFMNESARSLLVSPTLRSAEELRALEAQLLAVHWRLREFAFNPRAMDFATAARSASVGPMQITPSRLIDGDLALGEHAVAEAPPEMFQCILSSAQERHMAIHWLIGGGPVYSETDTLS